MFFALWLTAAALNAPSVLDMNILTTLTGLSFRNHAQLAAYCEFDSQVGKKETGFADIWLSHPTALFLDCTKEEAAPDLRHGII